jgi:hypothetical protein
VASGRTKRNSSANTSATTEPSSPSGRLGCRPGEFAGPREGVSRVLGCLAASSWRKKMKNPLDSLEGTVICGFLLTIVLYVIVKMTEGVAS